MFVDVQMGFWIQATENINLFKRITKWIIFVFFLYRDKSVGVKNYALTAKLVGSPLVDRAVEIVEIVCCF